MRFQEKEILYSSGALMLAAVAMLPDSNLNPGAVFIHGSGRSDRTNQWYQEIARHLASHNIAVLLPDKRGCHKSEGDWRKADFHDLAADSIAGVKALQRQNRVDPKRVGLIGISQGGWIAPLAASKYDVAFVISVSSATVTPIEQFRYEHTQDLREEGFPKAFAHISFPFARLLLRFQWPSWQDVKDFDPIPLWQTMAAPSLLVFGDEDKNVPVPQSIRRLESTIKQTRQHNLTVKVFHGSGHGLREPGSKQIRSDFLNLLVEWITKR